MKNILKYFFNSTNYDSFIIFAILILILIDNSQSIDNQFKKLIKLPNENYFVVKKNGIYIYNSNFSVSKIIYTFSQSETITTYDDSINTIISELIQNEKVYIICLSKKKIYFYDYENDKIYNSPYYLKKLSDNSDYCEKGVNYNLIPYKFINNNLSFFISLINKGIFNHAIIFLYYNINISLNTINLNKEITYYDKAYKLLGLGFSDLSPYNISCQISSDSLTESTCFYCRDHEKNFRSIKFNIENVPQYDDVIDIIENEKKIISMKSSISSDKSKIFACILLGDYSTQCFFNDKTKNDDFNLISYSILQKCKNMETYFFNETNDFVLICKNGNQFQVERLDYKKDNNINNNYKISYCYLITLKINYCNSLDKFSLIYNNTINDYNLISDYNFTNEENDCSIDIIKNDILFKEETSINTDKYSDAIHNTNKEYYIYSDETNNSNNNKEYYLDKIYSDDINFNKEYYLNKFSDYINFNKEYYLNKFSDEINNNLTLYMNKDDLEKIIEGFHKGDMSNISISKDFEKQIIEYGEYLTKILDFKDAATDNIIEQLQNVMNNTKTNETFSLKITNSNNNIQISSTDSIPPKDSTHADFDPCIKKLKKYYNISDSVPLKYVLFELKNDDPNSLHNQVEYAFFNDKNEKLNSSICKEETITIYYKINENSSLDISSVEKFKKKGVDILDAKNSFYNDICCPYSESGNDLILGDRRQDIFQNYSLCDKGCTYKNIDIENMLIICECNIKEKVNITLVPLEYEEFEDVSLMDSNIGVIICYQKVFSLEGKLENLGFLIFSFLLLSNIVLLIFYFYRGIKPIMEYLFKEMIKYGYLKKNHKFFFEVKNKLKTNKIKKINQKNEKIKKKSKRKNISNPIKVSKIKKAKKNKRN